jgi:hypothetical protein
MDWQIVALEEYKSLRAESLDSIRMQHLIVAIGGVAVGLLMVWGFLIWERLLVPDLVFLVFAPAICYTVLIVWMGEVARLMRVGFYLSEKEREISASFPEHPNALRWENWLRDESEGGRRHQVMLNYLAVVMLYASAAIVCLVVGNYRMIGLISTFWLAILDVFEILALSATLFYVYQLGQKFRKS